MKQLILIFSLFFLFSCGGGSDEDGEDDFSLSDQEELDVSIPPEPIWTKYPSATDEDLSVLNGATIHGIFYDDHLLSWDFGGDPFSEGWSYDITITNRSSGLVTVLDAYNDFTLYKSDLEEALGYTIEDRQSDVPLPDPMFFSMSIRGEAADGQLGPPSEVLNFALLKNSFSFKYISGDKTDEATYVGTGRGGGSGPSSAEEGADPEGTWNLSYFKGPYGLYTAEGQGPELGSNWTIKFWMLHPPQLFKHNWNDTLTYENRDMEPYVTNGFEYSTNYDSYSIGGGYKFGEYKNDPDGLDTGYTQIIGYNTYDVDGVTVDVLELSFKGVYNWTSAETEYTKTISGSGQFVIAND